MSIKVRVVSDAYINTKAIGIKGSPFIGRPGAEVEFPSKEAFEKYAANFAEGTFEVVSDGKAKAKAKAKGD